MDHDDLTAGLDDGGGILSIRDPETHRGWNGIRYRTGLSAKNVGARSLSMNVATVPPGAVAYAHEVLNLSDTEPVIAVVARSDASEWSNIVDYPSDRRPPSGDQT